MTFFLDYKELSLIINIAIATSKIRELILPHKRIRPFMHLLMHGQIGSGKSSILQEVLVNLKKVQSVRLSQATIYGTVDKQSGEFIPPVTWDSRNSVLGLDDFYVPKEGETRNVVRSLLSLMENPIYTKKIGFRCNEFKEKDKDLYCIVNKNIIEVKTRFVIFANTMANLNRKLFNPDFEAFASRCLILPYYPSLEDLKRKARGEPDYIYKNYKIKKDIVEIKKRNYNKILDFIDEYNIKEINYFRTLGDICRIFAIVGFKKDIFDLIMRSRNIEKIKKDEKSSLNNNNAKGGGEGVP